MSKRPELREVISRRAKEAAEKVLRNPENSKKAKTARGSALTQRNRRPKP